MKRTLHPAWPLLAFSMLALWIAACPPRPSPAPSAASPVPESRPHIPPGCSVNLSGLYVHALDPSFRYRAHDDGTNLVLDLNRMFPDGGTAGQKAMPSIRVERTPKGFVGRTRGVGILQSGEVCPVVEFLTEVVSCDDAGIVLRSAASARVDEACRPPELASPAPLLEQRLNRIRPLQAIPDAGVSSSSAESPQQ